MFKQKVKTFCMVSSTVLLRIMGRLYQLQTSVAYCECELD